MRRITILAGTVVAFAACESGREGEPDGAVHVRDSAGVTIVENTIAEPNDIPWWRIDTVPAMTIGKTSGESAYEFGRISGLRRLPNGMILVLGGQGERIFEFRFFDSTGKHVATHGRHGQGPGDFAWVTYVAPVGGDTVIAVDFPNSRISWVSASSGPVRTSRLDPEGFEKLIGPSAYSPFETMVPLDDSAYAIRSINGSNRDSGTPRTTTYHIVDLGRGVVHELTRYDDPPYKTVLQLSFEKDMRVYPENAGRPQHVADRSRGRLCAAKTSLPAISCIDRTGKRTIIRWAVDTIPFTDEDRRESSERLRRIWQTNREATPQDIEKIVAAQESPEHHLPISVLQNDSDGNFWILEPYLDSSRQRHSRYRVLAHDGRLIAFADSFPARSVSAANPLDIGRDAVLRVIENADGAQVIGVFPIRKPSSAPSR